MPGSPRHLLGSGGTDPTGQRKQPERVLTGATVVTVGEEEGKGRIDGAESNGRDPSFNRTEVKHSERCRRKTRISYRTE